MSHTHLLRELLLGEYFLKYDLKSLQFFFKNLKNFLILLCQGLSCKRFQKIYIYIFQKFWSLFINLFNAKKHALQCLMSVF
jgi:hypothetical protein